MHDLMELVAASFERHGIDCPPAGTTIRREDSGSAIALEQPLTKTLPEHNYRQIVHGDASP